MTTVDFQSKLAGSPVGTRMPGDLGGKSVGFNSTVSVTIGLSSSMEEFSSVGQSLTGRVEVVSPTEDCHETVCKTNEARTSILPKVSVVALLEQYQRILVQRASQLKEEFVFWSAGRGPFTYWSADGGSVQIDPYTMLSEFQNDLTRACSLIELVLVMGGWTEKLNKILHDVSESFNQGQRAAISEAKAYFATEVKRIRQNVSDESFADYTQSLIRDLMDWKDRLHIVFLSSSAFKPLNELISALRTDLERARSFQALLLITEGLQCQILTSLPKSSLFMSQVQQGALKKAIAHFEMRRKEIHWMMGRHT